MFLTKVVGTSQSECKCISGMDKTLRRFFCQCLAREDVACDADKALWSDPAVQQHPAEVFFSCIFFFTFFSAFFFFSVRYFL